MIAVTVWRPLDLHDRDLVQDLFDRVQLAFATSRANFTGSLPILFRLEIGIPKRPSSALPRTRLVDRTLAPSTVKEHAIAVGVLDQALANADVADVLFLELDYLHAQVARQRGNLLAIDPDIAGRARAAIAALGAFEAESLLEPRLFSHGKTFSFLSEHRSE